MPETEDFIRECCELDYDYHVQSSVLYDAYYQWCKNRGIFRKSPNQIALEWQRLGFNKTKVSKGVRWHGLKLREH